MKELPLYVLSLLFVLSACNYQAEETTYYLSLKGASETWELTDYEINLTPEERKAGDGKLVMKDTNKYDTDSFRFNTHAVTDDADYVIHEGSVSGQIDISEQHTGSIRGANESPIPFDKISMIYMEVEWWDKARKENVQERIELYKKSEIEETF